MNIEADTDIPEIVNLDIFSIEGVPTAVRFDLRRRDPYRRGGFPVARSERSGYIQWCSDYHELRITETGLTV